METARCKAFLASVDTGSFSRAADELNYTPSGVSQLVNALEKDLGFSLLRRTRRGVTPTANGEALIPLIRDLIRQEGSIYQLAAEMSGLAVGTVTIAAYTSIATHWLPAVIHAFQQDYPRIQIQLMEGNWQAVSRCLDEKRADIAFLSYQKNMPYDWIPLADDPMLAILPPSHPLVGADAYPLSHLPQERFIMPVLGHDEDLLALFRANHVRPDARFSTSESFSAMSMIEQGLGVSIMNELITRNWPCNVVKLPLDPPQKITLGMALPSLEQAAPAVKRFFTYAYQHLHGR